MGPKPAKKKGGKALEKKKGSSGALAQLDEDQLDVPDMMDLGMEGVAAETEEKLELTEEELNQDVTMILKAENPYFSDEYVEFNFKDLEYKPISNFPHTVTFFSQSGSLLHKDSQAELEEESGETQREPEVTVRKNKFTFCDRAVQTINPYKRDESLQTEPPVVSKFSADAGLWEMTKTFEATPTSDSDATHVPPVVVPKKMFPHEGQAIEGLGLEKVKVLERMLNQNRFFDTVIDCSFYDNPADQYREGGEGTLLPLWKFKFKKLKGYTVMEISWNFFYPDMFALAFGSKDFYVEAEGCVCIFTLKCTSYPERIFMLDSYVQCVNFNKQCHNLLVAGCGDGNVAVFDLSFRNKNEPIASSRGLDLEHCDCVTEVKWLNDDINGYHNFCSISISGEVMHWTLSKDELIPIKLIALKSVGHSVLGPNNTLLPHGGVFSYLTCMLKLFQQPGHHILQPYLLQSLRIEGFVFLTCL